MPVLILSRGLQGLGGGGIMPVVQSVISDVVTPRERGQYQAYFSGVWMAAGIGGAGVGGPVLRHLNRVQMIFVKSTPRAPPPAPRPPQEGTIPTFLHRPPTH